MGITFACPFLRPQKAAASSAIARGLNEKLDSLALMVNAYLRCQAFGAIRLARK